MILLLDNYDSFTYNLFQYLSELGADVLVKRNDELSVGDVAALAPEKIVISPGPCTPNEAGISVALIRELGGQVPVLGDCLGHQAVRAPHSRAVGGAAGDARQAVGDSPWRRRCVRRPARAFPGYALSLADRPARRPARQPGGDRLDRGWADHGAAPSRSPGRGRAVSPRVNHDRGGQGDAAEFSG